MNHAWTATATALADAGCDLVVGIPADEPGLLDAAAAHPLLRAVVVRDQRVGACMAAGAVTVSQRPAVLALTSGPPFPNALAGLAEASSMGVPLVVVTTRVAARELGKGAFQETDQRSMASSLVKWHHLADSADQLTWAVRHAVRLAVNGRPGVTVVEVAHEVIQEDRVASCASTAVLRVRSVPAPEDVARAAESLRSAARPLLVAGGGARAAKAGPALLHLAERLSAPVMTTAAGRGTVPETHPLGAGLVGLYATPPLDRLMAEADVVLAVGTRLEETARMGWRELERQHLVHVDADPGVFGQAVEADTALLGDAALTVERLAEAVERGGAGPARDDWRSRLAELEAAARAEHLGPHAVPSTVREALAAVGHVYGPEVTYVHENGLHDMWSYHYPLLPIGPKTKVVVPGEQTLLGFGLPAAVGAAMVDRGRPTVLLCGDGALAMNLPAIVTAAEQRIGLTVVVFDNAGFGWPRHLRALEGQADHLTRFSLPYPVDEVITALGGTVSEPVGDQRLRAALERAHATSAAGSVAVVRVRVGDDDIPPGVARVSADHSDG